ncbi:sucrase ferredoxin [Kineococcus indalonis]|uniref:sucrase ferredoxin n=1 Tax=Kineococcus indalonis TaxID=2696566 RepID=UPI0014128247|nr:sucrase ferredoxin [Kineococcus indalonis]NAZ86110.1 sucrase ferredoxin [Kineococcus indalonis]
MLGTATAVRGYLLVEEPGPWGPGALPASRLGEAVTTALKAVAARRGLKPLLVRRPHAAGRDPDGPRRLFLADCRRGAGALLTRLADPADLAVAAADEEGWSAARGPLLLVCTHGRKDWCCAVRGRPVVTALAALDAEAVWECSHLGGDRFAATVLALPGGAVHGHVEPDDAAALLAAVRAGRVLPAKLRGRCGDAVVVQAAEGHARLLLGEDRLEAFAPRRAERLPDAPGGRARWRVSFEAGGAPLEVDLREGRAPAQRLTCSAAGEQEARTWELEELRR